MSSLKQPASLFLLLQWSIGSTWPQQGFAMQPGKFRNSTEVAAAPPSTRSLDFAVLLWRLSFLWSLQMSMALLHNDASSEANKKKSFFQWKTFDDKTRLEPEAKCPEPITGFQDPDLSDLKFCQQTLIVTTTNKLIHQKMSKATWGRGHFLLWLQNGMKRD